MAYMNAQRRQQALQLRTKINAKNYKIQDYRKSVENKILHVNEFRHDHFKCESNFEAYFCFSSQQCQPVDG